MVYAPPGICPEEWNAQTPLGFLDKTDHLMSSKRPDLVTSNKRKRTCGIVDFDVPANHRMKLKENEKDREKLER